MGEGGESSGVFPVSMVRLEQTGTAHSELQLLWSGCGAGFLQTVPPTTEGGDPLNDATRPDSLGDT